MVGGIPFTFHMCIAYSKNFTLVPRSRSSVEIKYQGHTFQKIAVTGTIASNKYSLFV